MTQKIPIVRRIPTFCGELHIDLWELWQFVEPIVRSRHPDVDTKTGVRLLNQITMTYCELLPGLLHELLTQTLSVAAVDAETPGYLNWLQRNLLPHLGYNTVDEILQNPIMT